MGNKHKSIDDFRGQSEMFKMNLIKQHQEQQKNKEEMLLNFMKKKEEMQNTRSQNIQIRQESIEKKRRMKQAEMRKTMQEKSICQLKKEEFVSKKKSQYEIFKEEYDSRIKEKLNKINERVIYRKEKDYIEMINKFDNLQIRREDNLEKYISNEKAHEYEREKRFEIITAKMRRIDEMK